MADTTLKVKFEAAVKKFQRDVKAAKLSLKDIGPITKNVGRSLSRNLSAPLATVGALALKQSMNFEKLKTSLNVLTGSAEAGGEAFENLVKFSAKTPFQLNELAAANNKLMGFGLSANQSLESLKLLGDIAAVSGGDLNGMTVAFGQAAAEGRLMTRDIMQLVNNGVPAYKLLAEQVGVSTAEIRKMASEGEVSFDILVRALQDATAEGGMFANGMEVLSGTLAGVTSTVKDNLSIALAQLGDEIVKAFDLVQVGKDFTKFVQDSVKGFESLTITSKKLIIQLGAFATIGPPIMYLAATVIPKLYAAMTFLAANPAIALVGALAAIGVSIYNTTQNFNDFKGALKESTKNIEKLKSQTKKLQKDAIDGNADAVRRLYEHYVELATAEKNRFVLLKEQAKRQGLSKAVLQSYDAEIEKHTKNIDLYSKALSDNANDLDVANDSLLDYASNTNKATEKVREFIKVAGNLQRTKGLEIDSKNFGVEGVKQFGGKGTFDTGVMALPSVAPTADTGIESLKVKLRDLQQQMVQTAGVYEYSFTEAAQSVGMALGDALVNGGNVFAAFGSSILSVLGDILIKIGNAGIAAAKLSATFLTPAGLVAGIAAVALGAAVKGFASKMQGGGITAFANGGIVSGPTLGLMGEYGGARSNPEVIAPLDKLNGMIGQTGTNVNVGGEFRVQGQDLVLALQRADKQRNRII